MFREKEVKITAKHKAHIFVTVGNVFLSEYEYLILSFYKRVTKEKHKSVCDLCSLCPINIVLTMLQKVGLVIAHAPYNLIWFHQQCISPRYHCLCKASWRVFLLIESQISLGMHIETHHENDVHLFVKDNHCNFAKCNCFVFR